MQDFVTTHRLNATFSIDKYMWYGHLAPSFQWFFGNVSKILEPTCYDDVARDPAWVIAMNEELTALQAGELKTYLLERNSRVQMGIYDEI